MSSIYRPPMSELDPERETGTKLFPLAVIFFIGFPGFVWLQWNLVPILNEISEYLVSEITGFYGESILLAFDLIYGFISYLIFTYYSIKVTRVNPWLFALTIGIINGLVVLYEKDWSLIATSYPYPAWYEVSSVFVSLLASMVGASLFLIKIKSEIKIDI